MHNLHGIPGVLGGIAAIIMSLMINGDHVDTIFPLRADPEFTATN